MGIRTWGAEPEHGGVESHPGQVTGRDRHSIAVQEEMGNGILPAVGRIKVPEAFVRLKGASGIADIGSGREGGKVRENLHPAGILDVDGVKSAAVFGDRVEKLGFLIEQDMAGTASKREGDMAALPDAAGSLAVPPGSRK